MDESDISRIATELEAGFTEVQRTFDGRSDAELGRHPAAGEWCAKQVLGHLVEAEGEVFGALIPGMLGREAPPDWDRPPSMVRDDCDRDAATLLARFTALRARGVALARSLKAEDMTVTSDRNWHKGPIESVGDLLRHWPEHTSEHVAQARAVAAQPVDQFP